MIITILKIAGASLFIAGVLLGLYTLIYAGRTGLKDDMAELKLIKETGYTKEHAEERREDIYRTEPVAQTSRRMSRRAKRVLERMNETGDEPRSTQDAGRNDPVIEEVVPDNESQKQTIKREPEETAPPAEKMPKRPAPDAVAPSEEGTDILPGSSAEGTDVLGESMSAAVSAAAAEGTDILPGTAPESTGVLPPSSAEQTDVLGSSTRMEEGTAVLGAEETDVLPQQNAKGKSDEEGTAVLEAEGTDVLPPQYAKGRPDEEGTDILVADRADEDVFMTYEELVGRNQIATGEATDILES